MPGRRDASPHLAIAARPLLERPGHDGARRDLLTPTERARLAPIASLVRIERGTVLFEEGAPASAVYNVADGVLKCLTHRADGTRAILGFFFPQDIVGLVENGRYVTTAQAVTAAVLYRLPLAALERLLKRDSELDHQFLIKACHELRQAQVHTLTLCTAHADTRLARFLDMLRHMHHHAPAAVELPMSRADIAEYLCLTPETVSRSFARLRRAHILACPTPHLVNVLDEERFRATAEQDASQHMAQTLARPEPGTPRRTSPAQARADD